MVNLFWEAHAGNGPPLLLVHGFLMSRAQWQLNLAALAEVSQPVVVELWGHGRSPSPDNLDAYHPDHLVSQLDGIREAIGAERWALCGYSLGAGLTLRYAQTHPERVIAHAWTNSTSALAEEATVQTWAEEAENTRQRFRTRGREAIDRIAVHPKRAKRIPQCVMQPLLADAELLNPMGIANIMTGTNLDISMRKRVAKNARPSLLICGTAEKRFQPFREFAEANMANLSVEEINCGHGVNMEDAQAFNSKLVRFLTCHSQ